MEKNKLNYNNLIKNYLGQHMTNEQKNLYNSSINPQMNPQMNPQINMRKQMDNKEFKNIAQSTREIKSPNSNQYYPRDKNVLAQKPMAGSETGPRNFNTKANYYPRRDLNKIVPNSNSLTDKIVELERKQAIIESSYLKQLEEVQNTQMKILELIDKKLGLDKKD